MNTEIVFTRFKEAHADISSVVLLKLFFDTDTSLKFNSEKSSETELKFKSGQREDTITYLIEKKQLIINPEWLKYSNIMIAQFLMRQFISIEYHPPKNDDKHNDNSANNLDFLIGTPDYGFEILFGEDENLILVFDQDELSKVDFHQIVKKLRKVYADHLFSQYTHHLILEEIQQNCKIKASNVIFADYQD